MKIGLGLSLSSPRGAGASAFDPLTLNPAKWHDPSILNSMWQDTAGTTTPAAVDQPVGHILDLSGNGYHWTAPSDSARPTLRISGGVSYLEFDGTDDVLADDKIDLTNGAAVAHSILAVRIIGGGTRQLLRRMSNASSTAYRHRIQSAAGVMTASVRYDGVADAVTTPGTTDVRNADIVVSALSDPNDKAYLWQDLTLIGSSPAPASLNTAFPATNELGADYANGTTVWLQHRFYGGGTWRTKLTKADQDTVVKFLAARQARIL